jgi:hypothetical protein
MHSSSMASSEVWRAGGIYYYFGACVLQKINLMANGRLLKIVSDREGETRYVGKWEQRSDTLILFYQLLYRTAKDMENVADTAIYSVWGPETLRPISKIEVVFRK